MRSVIKGLSYVGIFTNDLENIVLFYQDVVGLKISHRSDRGVFMSSDPQREDHEVVFFKAPEVQAPTKTQQLSFRVNSVQDVLNYYKNFKRLGVPIQSTVSHGAGVSCYFMDPEGRRTEVFADIVVEGGRGYSGPLDLERSADELIHQIRTTRSPVAAGRM